LYLSKEQEQSAILLEIRIVYDKNETKERAVRDTNVGYFVNQRIAVPTEDEVIDGYAFNETVKLFVFSG
jgi:hypothetical protein